MTFADLEVVERHADAVAREMDVDRPPVMKPEGFDRVDIDAAYLQGADPGAFAERLELSLRAQGHPWDVWVNGSLVSVSEREEAE